MRSWENGYVGQKDRRGKQQRRKEREREKDSIHVCTRRYFPSSRDVRGVKNGFSVSTALSPYVFPVVLHAAFCFRVVMLSLCMWKVESFLQCIQCNKKNIALEMPKYVKDDRDMVNPRNQWRRRRGCIRNVVSQPPECCDWIFLGLLAFMLYRHNEKASVRPIAVQICVQSS